MCGIHVAGIVHVKCHALHSTVNFGVNFSVNFVVHKIDANFALSQYCVRDVVFSCCDISKMFTRIDSALITQIVDHISEKFQIDTSSIRTMMRTVHNNKRSACKKAENQNRSGKNFCNS